MALGGKAVTSWTQSGPTSAQDLTAARSAIAGAATESGFLKAGTGAVVSGAEQLADGTNQAVSGAAQIKDGSAQLASGMVQLQAGTGQLQAGADQLAAGVTQAVDTINGMLLLKGQLDTFIAQADSQLATVNDERAQQMRGQLQNIKEGLAGIRFDAATVDQVAALRSGANDLSAAIKNQLSPGVYQATNGAKQLDSAMSQLQTGLQQLQTGAGELATGAKDVDQAATQTSQKITSAARAMPTNQQKQEQTMQLGPLYALGISLLFLLCLRRGSWLIAGVLAGAATWVVGDHVVWWAAVAAGAVVAVAGYMWHNFSRLAGLPLTLVLAAVQLLYVGSLWKQAASGQTGTSEYLAALMPLHYVTYAVTALGNGRTEPMMYGAVGIIIALAVVTWLACNTLLTARATLVAKLPRPLRFKKAE